MALVKTHLYLALLAAGVSKELAEAAAAEAAGDVLASASGPSRRTDAPWYRKPPDLPMEVLVALTVVHAVLAVAVFAFMLAAVVRH